MAHPPAIPPPELVQEIYLEPFTILDDTVEEPERPLPTNLVNIRVIQDLNIADILMLLSRAANINLVLSPSVHNISGVARFKFENIPWDNAFRGLLRSHGLTYFWEGEVLKVYTQSDIENDIKMMETIKRHQTMTAERGRLDPLVTSIIKLRYLSAGKSGTISKRASQTDRSRDQFSTTSTRAEISHTAITERLLPLLSLDESGRHRGSIHYEPDINSLVVHATRLDTNKILRLLEHLDQPRPQVHIQAHIVETSKEMARDLGIQWGGRRAGVNAGQPWMVAPGVGQRPAATGDPRPTFDYGQGSGGMAGNFPADLQTTLTGLSLGFITGGANYLEMQLSALQRDGKLNILSSPSISTMDNHSAFTKSGEEVPYVTYEFDSESMRSQNVKFKDAVLSLEITPSVIDDNSLRLSIHIVKDEVDFSRMVSGNPLILKKETQTQLVVGNTETVVISGLTKEVSRQRLDGVPWLQDIPGLGALFRRDNTGRLMEDIVIFITPTILPERPIPLSQNTVPRPLTQ
ncbi:type IV pilus secretin PilQ [Desulfonatronum thioautotrophicum]|uniref:type IV pilus secretin PilQ n=1 Tax=Desulfonatronum thioautotrophicum TaxID=617001 RepID=UPI0013791CFE|nr:type IV pilus secretin PilQ [Desulfonatronum thioautotrophicum]